MPGLYVVLQTSVYIHCTNALFTCFLLQSAIAYLLKGSFSEIETVFYDFVKLLSFQAQTLDVNSTAVVKYTKMGPIETYSTLELVSHDSLAIIYLSC